MATVLPIAEIFGYDVKDVSVEAKSGQVQKQCPFRGTPCTKMGKRDPVAICSYGDGQQSQPVCPVRFLESGRLFRDVSKIAFGEAEVAAFPEFRLLKVKSSETGKQKRIGKVDFLVAKLENGQPVDYAAVEVQAVYVSGSGSKKDFRQFIRTGKLAKCVRRLDYRSSAQKRLMPQLSLKVPVFRRWNKKFFVAVDEVFFSKIPAFKKAKDWDNSELTWLVYPFRKVGRGYQMQEPQVHYSIWEDVAEALREGEPPTKAEVLQEIASRLPKLKRF